MKFVKTFEEYKADTPAPARPRPAIEPDTRPDTRPVRPVRPAEPETPPNYDPDYEPGQEGIERPSVDPDPQAKEKKALSKVIDRYKKEKK